MYDFDHLTLWLIKAFLGFFHDLVGRWYKSPSGTEGSDPPIVHYDDAHLQLPASLLSTFLASLLPVLSIVALYLVESMPKRLTIAAVFTSTFSVALALVTTARRVENFAATAAWVFTDSILETTKFAPILTRPDSPLFWSSLSEQMDQHKIGYTPRRQWSKPEPWPTVYPAMRIGYEGSYVMANRT
jgi:hypothetical protein